MEYGTLEKALPGLKYGIDGTVITGCAVNPIAFGAPVYGVIGEENKVGPLLNDKVTLGFSVDFSASNVIAGNVTVAGGAAVAYSVTYATSHAATFAALVAALDAVPGVEVVSSDATARSIVLSANGETLVVTGAVTGGTAVTVTNTAGTEMVLRGVALRSAKAQVAGVERYEETDPVNVITAGEVWVQTNDAVLAQKQAYLTSGGAWTDEASGNTATGFMFRSSTAGAGLARLELK